MNERLPKDCSRCIDQLEKVFGHNYKLGFSVAGSGLKNTFKLRVKNMSIRVDDDMPVSIALKKVYINFRQISVHGISKLIDARYPDFLLKHKAFISIDDICSRYDIDKEALAAAVFKSIKTMIKDYCKYGDCIYMEMRNLFNYDESEIILSKDNNVRTLNEFLLWIDLNAKS